MGRRVFAQTSVKLIVGNTKSAARGRPTDTNGNLGAPEIGSFNFIAGKREFRGTGISRKHRRWPARTVASMLMTRRRQALDLDVSSAHS